MPITHILTDSSIQFTRHAFQGRSLIHVIPFKIIINGVDVSDDPNFKVTQIPQSLLKDSSLVLSPPSVEDFTRMIDEIGQETTDIIAIVMSGHLTKTWENLEKAASASRGKISIQIIDSQSIGLGLGFLVQLAAELASRKVSPMDIEYQIRGRIPHVYAQFCLPNLTYLHRAGIIGYPQSLVGEILSLLPIFTFEEGRIVSLEKVRNTRHLLDNFQEFLDEFSGLDYVAYMQSVPPLISEARSLKEHSAALFNKTPFTEHTINPVLAALFGPHSVGVFAIEPADEE